MNIGIQQMYYELQHTSTAMITSSDDTEVQKQSCLISETLLNIEKVGL